MKHIESILPEHAADELTRMLAGDDATATAALTRLLHDWTGCDIPQTSDLPASEVEELVPLCVSILRRHWKTPLTCLGDGSTPMSLADLLRQTIGDRVQGNEAWSIPPANANIPTAVAALRDRKISNGGSTDDGIADGVSLAHLLCGDYASVTEIKDDNPAWGELRGSNYVSTLLGIFPNVTKVTLNCSKSIAAVANNLPALTELNVPYLRYITKANGVNVFSGLGITEFTIPCVSFTTYFGKLVNSCSSLKKLYLPNLETVRCTNDNNNSMIANCSALEEVYAEKVHSIYIYRSTDNADNGFVANCVNLKKIIFGDIGSWNYAGIDRENRAPNLIDIEFKSVSCSINLAYWEAANVLSGDNLTTFLQNFREHIAERLTDKGSGLTLTLSQAVRDAIQGDPEIVSIITSKGWTISPAPSV